MTVVETKQQAVLVLGMHRSGTSAVTRVLNLLGAELNQVMLAAAHDNPKGFWESAEAVALHERLLAGLSRTWYDMHELPSDWKSQPVARAAVAEICELVRRDFSGKALWVIKDPRMCLFVPLWLEALATLDIEVKALLVARNPIEVARSLRVRNKRERNQWDLGYAPVMWAQYLASSEAATRHLCRAMLTYDELLCDWRAAMARIGEDLDIRWPRGFEEIGADVDAFLDQDERHHEVPFRTADALAVGIPELVIRMYSECLSIARRQTDWQGLRTLADEYFAAADFYAGALDNLFEHYQTLLIRDRENEDGRAHAEALVVLKEQSLEEYRRQAETYAMRLASANAGHESLLATYTALVEAVGTQSASFERDLAAYKSQAKAYDDLLREANGRIEGLGASLEEYQRQAITYDSLLASANRENVSLQAQHTALIEAVSVQAASFERDLAAYKSQAQAYDDLLREASGRIEGLGAELEEYRRQAITYDSLLASANRENVSLQAQYTALIEAVSAQAASFERELAAYREQAQAYDELLRQANGRIESMSKQLQDLLMGTTAVPHSSEP